MTFTEFISTNGVVIGRYGEPDKNVENVIGKEVYICDYRNGDDVFGKPIRNVEPRLVRVLDAEEAKKNIYYSPVFFREVKEGKLLKQEIAPFDNTGFRGRTGTAVNVFYSMEECARHYAYQVKIATKECQDELLRLEKVHNEKFDAMHKLFAKWRDFR